MQLRLCSLLRVAHASRGLKGHGLAEGASTRLLVYAASLIKQGIAPATACKMALIQPVTDDPEIAETLQQTIDAILI